MKNKYYGFGLLALLVVIAVGGLWHFNKPSRNLVNESAGLQISAPELYRQFSENEAEANQQYLDKVVQVRGTLQTLNRGQGGTLNLILDAGNPMGGVICEVLAGNLPQGMNLKTGSELTLKGQCTGFLMDVVLVKCVIVP